MNVNVNKSAEIKMNIRNLKNLFWLSNYMKETVFIAFFVS